MNRAEELVAMYSKQLYSYNEIQGFLLLEHGILVSLTTIKRIKQRLNLTRNCQESLLRDIVSTTEILLHHGFSEMGYRSMWRVLNTQCGLTVTQESTRRVLRGVDNIGVEARARRRLRRRRYFNRGPNYVIHIDGYDKLKPYGFPIHGAVDGFSRKVLWLKVGPSNNNPRYVARLYMDYLKKIQGVPRTVRADAGSENVLVKDLQTAFRLEHDDVIDGTSSFLTGRSTANQRIERLWGSLRTNLTMFWKNYFQDLQDEGFLNNCDKIHIQAVRFCFMPIIQNHLDIFRSNWNNHRIRSQRHTLNPCGIPNVLYHQPAAYSCIDHKLPLPCDMDTLHRISQEYTWAFPERGCDPRFLEIIQLLTATPEVADIVPQTVDEARDLFTSIIHRLEAL